MTGKYQFRSGTIAEIISSGTFTSGRPTYSTTDSITVNRGGGNLVSENISTINLTPATEARKLVIGDLGVTESQKVEFFANNTKTLLPAPITTGTNPQIVGDVIQQASGIVGPSTPTSFSWNLTSSIDKIVITSQSTGDDIFINIQSPCNEAPIAVADSYTLALNGLVYIDPILNDTDPQNEILSLVSINNTPIVEGTVQTITVPNGIVTTDINGLIKFTPSAEGVSTFPYEIKDPNGSKATNNVSIKINPSTGIGIAPLSCDKMYGLTNVNNIDQNLYNQIQVINNDSSKSSSLTATSVNTSAIELDKNSGKLFYVSAPNASPSNTLFFFDPSLGTHTNTGQKFTLIPTNYIIPVDSGASFKTMPNEIKGLAVDSKGQGYALDLSGKIFKFNTTAPYSISSVTIQVKDNLDDTIPFSITQTTDVAVTNNGNLLALSWAVGTPGGQKNTPYLYRINDMNDPTATSRGIIGSTKYDEAFGGFAFGTTNNLFMGEKNGSLNEVDRMVLSSTNRKIDNTGIKSLTSCIYPPLQRQLGLTKTFKNITDPTRILAQPSDVIEYTLTARNTGDIILGGASITDKLPEGVEYVLNTTTLNGISIPDEGGLMPYISPSPINSIGSVSGVLKGDSTPNTVDNEAIVKFKVKIKSPIPSGVFEISNHANVTADSITNADSDDPSKPGENDPTITPLDLKTDLILTKTVSNPTPNRNELITFTIVVKNQGTVDAGGVVVSEAIPAGLEFVSANTQNSAYDPFSGKWNIGTIKAGGTQTLEVTVNVANTNETINTAEATSSTFDTNLTNNKVSVKVTPKISDLEITSSTSVSRPNVGDVITMQIKIKNKGKDTATNVINLLTSPVNTVIQNTTVSKGTISPSLTADQWSIDELAVGEEATVTYTSKIVSGNKATITGAIINSDTFDNVSTNNNTTSEIYPLQADLVITKAVSNASPNVGETIEWIVRLDNKGPDDSLNIEVTDTMPTGVEYLSHELPANFDSTYTITGTNGTGVWKIPKLVSATSDQNNSSKTIKFKGKVKSTIKETNKVLITKNATFDPILFNNNASASETPRRTDVQVIKSVSNPIPGIGESIVYTMKLKNNGPDRATNIQLKDTFPSEVFYVTHSTTTGTYDKISGIWNNIVSMEVGEEQTLQISAKPTKIGVFTNIIEVTALDQFDTNLANNRSEAQIDVQSADLEILKTVSNQNPDLYSEIEYNLQIKNLGPKTAKNVIVIDKLSSDLQFISATSPEKPTSNYNLATGLWSGIGDIAFNETFNLKVKAKVIGKVASITNQAKVSADTPDDLVFNNVSNATIYPVFADLKIEKMVDNNRPFLYQNVTYTLKVSNLGQNIANNVIVKDTLPTGYDLVSANSSNGSFANNEWKLGSPLAPNTSAEIYITAKVNNPNKTTNTAKVSGKEVDPDMTNNTASVDVDAISNDIKVTKTPSNAKPSYKANVIYNILVENIGEDVVQYVKFIDKLPTGVTFVSSSNPGYNPTTGELILENIKPGDKINIAITARVDAINGPITNCVEIPDVPGDVNEQNNSSCADITPDVANLKADKNALTPEVNIGANGKYEIIITNEGPQIARNVVLKDPIPANSELISTDIPGYNNTTGIANLGDMAKGETKKYTFEIKVLNKEKVINTVEVSTDTVESNYNDNKDSAEITPVGADTSIDKSSSNPKPNLYSEFEYKLVVKNDGPSTAKNTKVTEALPTGIEYVSHVSSKGTWDKSIWTIGDLANGETATMTIKAIMKSLVPVVNDVKVTSDTFDYNLNNNEDREKNDPVYADLQVVKLVDNATPDAGSIVNFTIKFTNAGPYPSEDVVIEDVLPSGYAILDASTTLGTLSSDKKTVNIAKLNVNESGELKYKVQLPLNTEKLTNVVTIKSNKTPDNDTNNNKSEASANPKASDMEVIKTASNVTPKVNEEFDYILKVTNKGPNDTTDVVLTDTLSSDLEFIGVSADGGATAIYDATSRTITATLGSLATNGTFTVKIKVKAISFIPSINNEATVKSKNVDLDLSNNKSSTTINPRYTVLKLAKTVDNPKPQVGEEVTYTITLDVSVQPADNVQVKETLPPTNLAQFVSASTVTGIYDSSAHIWKLGNVGIDKYELKIKVKELSHLPNKNVVSVSTDTPQKDPETPKEVDVDPNGKPDAIDDTGITKPTLPILMGLVDGNLATTNSAPASDSSIKDTDPDNDPLIITQINGQPVIVGQIITLPDGAKVTITSNKTVTVDPVDLLREAPIKFTYTISDSNGGTDTANVTVTLIPLESDVEADKKVDNAKPQVGEIVTFTLKTTNLGPDKAIGVLVEDVMPSNFKFISSSDSKFDSTNNTLLIGDLEVSTSYTFTIKAEALDEKPSENVMKVSSKTKDKNLSNNISKVPLDPNGKPDAKDDTGITKPTLPILMGIVDGNTAITNPTPAVDSSVTDTDPDNDPLVITQINGQPVIVGQTIILPDGAKVTITSNKTVTVDAVNPLREDPIKFTYTISDGNGGTDTANVTVTLIPLETDLEVDKQADNPKPQVGNTTIFTIITRNLGPDVAVDVVTKDILPSNFELVSVSDSKYDKATNSISLGYLNPGQNHSFTLVAKALDEKPSINVAETTSKTKDKNLSNNRKEVPLDPNGRPDAKDDTGTTRPGQPIEMCIVPGKGCKNPLPNTTDNSVTDTDPDGDDLTITNIDGKPVKPGDTITLDSGDKVTVNPDGKSVRIEPKDSSSIETIKFTYTITDGNGGTDTANVTVTLTNTAPTAVDDYGITFPDMPIDMKIVEGGKEEANEKGQFDLSKADSDPENDGLMISQLDGQAVIGDQEITLSNGAKVKLYKDLRTINVTAANATTTKDFSFPYQITDGKGGFASAIVKVKILVNPSPDVDKTPLNTPITVNALSNDIATDPVIKSFDGAKVVKPNPDGTLPCETGQIFKDGECVDLPQDCPVGEVKDVNGKCVPKVDPVNCKDNEKLENGVCVPKEDPKDCPAGEEKNAQGKCVPKKDDNKPCDGLSGVLLIACKLLNGIASIQPLSAPFGEVLVDAQSSTAPKITNIVKVTNGTAKLNSDGSVTVTPNQNYSGIIEFTYEVADSDGDMKQTTVTITIPEPIADIDNSKKVDNGTPYVGEVIEFTLGVVNRGPDTSKNVYVVDKLPEGLEYVSDNSNGAYDKSSGKWTVGDMPNGSTKEIKIKAKALKLGKVVNVATVYTDTQDPTPNPPKEVPVDPKEPKADIDNSKAVDNGTPMVGEIIEFTLGVVNRGPDTSKNVYVMDKLPEGLVYVSDNSAGKYDPATGKWSIGDMPNGDKKEIKIKVKATRLGKVVNVATVFTDTTDPTPNPPKEVPVDPKSPPVPMADLDVVKTVKTNGTPLVGDTIDYTITVTNKGPDSAEEVEIEDVLPKSLAFISSNNPNYNSSNNIIKIAQMKKSEIFTLTIKAKVLESGVIENTATVKSKTPDPDPKNNKSTVKFVVGKPTPRTGANNLYFTVIFALLAASTIVFVRNKEEK
ncbi:MAG: Ig-like domain-containing protein [Patescibacteria group bacterium]